MANQNNLSLTRQETCIRFGLQASHVVCKDANNPTIEHRFQSIPLSTLCRVVNTACEQFHCWPMLYSEINIIAHLYVWLYEHQASWTAATSRHMFSCDAATLALCTANAARAENKPKYAATNAEIGTNNQSITL